MENVIRRSLIAVICFGLLNVTLRNEAIECYAMYVRSPLWTAVFRIPHLHFQGSKSDMRVITSAFDFSFPLLVSVIFRLTVVADELLQFLNATKEAVGHTNKLLF
jgi:hypothetical protein